MRWMIVGITFVLNLVAATSSGASFEYFPSPVDTPVAWASFAFDQSGNNLACNYEGRLFHWSIETGFLDLGMGHANSSSVGISGDGSTICATRTRRSDGYRNPALWKKERGWTDLGYSLDGCVKGDSWGSAFGLNFDGSEAVGLAWTCQGGQAFHWNMDVGITGLSPSPQQSTSRATAIARNGSFIVGFVDHSQLNYRRPAIWVNEGAAQFYGGPELPGEALDLDSAGTQVVGYHLEDKVEQAHYWTAEDGLIGLGTLSGMPYDNSRATHISDLGQIFGHSSNSAWGINEAFAWDRFDGMVRLQDHLISQGIPIPSNIWLDRVLAVSGDGSTLLGNWKNAQGEAGQWIARNNPPVKGRIRECLAQIDGTGLELRFELSRPDFVQRPILVASQGNREWIVPLAIEGLTCTGTDHNANLLESGEVTYSLTQVFPDKTVVMDQLSIWSDQKPGSDSFLSGTLFKPAPPDQELLLRISKSSHLRVSIRNKMDKGTILLSDRHFHSGLHRITMNASFNRTTNGSTGQFIHLKWQ